MSRKPTADKISSIMLDALRYGYVSYMDTNDYGDRYHSNYNLTCGDLELFYGQKINLFYYMKSRQNALQVAIMQPHCHATRVNELFRFSEEHKYRGAEIIWQDEAGENALHTAVRYVVNSKKNPHRVAILTMMLQCASREDITTALSQVNTAFGQTPLLLAYELGNTAVIEVLEKVGADCDAIDNRGWTTLHSAVARGRLDLIKKLCDEGRLEQLINLRAKNGDTALHIAARLGQSDIVDYLLTQNANTSFENNANLTPLCQAVRLKKYDVLRVIVTHLQNRQSGTAEQSIAVSFAASKLLAYMNTRTHQSYYFHFLQHLFPVGYSKADKIAAAGKYLGCLFTKNHIGFKTDPVLFSKTDEGALHNGLLGKIFEEIKSCADSQPPSYQAASAPEKSALFQG